MEPTQTIDQAPVRADLPEDAFDKTAKTGWEWFTKFLFWNVIAAAGSLIVIGLLTVWS